MQRWVILVLMMAASVVMNLHAFDCARGAWQRWDTLTDGQKATVTTLVGILLVAGSTVAALGGVGFMLLRPPAP